MTVSTTCPYCNALLPAVADSCPVCGERMASPTPTLTGEKAPSPTVPPVSTGANRRALMVILTGMLAVGLIGLGYALWTQTFRRANDQGQGLRPARSPFETPPGVLVPPDHLAALGFLPSGLDLLVGIHFATLYDDPALKALLDQSLPLGPTRIRLADLQTWTGLEPRAIDHAVLGVGLPRDGLPRVVLVVRTRTDYDGEEVKRRLQARLVFDAGRQEKKTLWNVRLGKLNLPTVLWLADERTLVLGLTPADLSEIHSTESPSQGQLSEGIRELLRQRLDAGVALWSVGALRDGLRGLAGTAVSGVLDRLRLTPAQRAAVLGLERFSAGVVPGQELVCRLDLELASGEGAREVARYLRGPEARSNPRVIDENRWVLLQWKASREQLMEALRP